MSATDRIHGEVPFSAAEPVLVTQKQRESSIFTVAEPTEPTEPQKASSETSVFSPAGPEVCWLLGVLTVLVLDVGAGSTSEQLQGALLLAPIGRRVQRRVSQQVGAVDVWRLFPAELQ